MSYGEILVITIIAIMCLKPEDVPKVVQYWRQLSSYWHQFTSSLSLDHVQTMPDEIHDDQVLLDLNFYLERITALNGRYEGDYSIEKVRKYYHALLTKEIQNT